MSRRKAAWIALTIVGLIAAAGIIWSMVGTTRISFTEAEIQDRLNKQLPKTVREVTIEQVNVRIADNRLAFRITLQAKALRQTASAVLAATGVPRYEARDGEVFFDADEVKLLQLTVAGKTIAGEDESRGKVADAIGATVQRLAESGIKAYLAGHPVYRFRDNIRGIVLRSALGGIAIENNAVVVTVALWNLTVTVAFFALLILGVLWFIYYLIRHPRWGLRKAADIAGSVTDL